MNNKSLQRICTTVEEGRFELPQEYLDAVIAMLEAETRMINAWEESDIFEDVVVVCEIGSMDDMFHHRIACYLPEYLEGIEPAYRKGNYMIIEEGALGYGKE